MTTYRKKHIVTRPGIEVAVGYCSELREYRVRLKRDGVAYEPADYFTTDKQDAYLTADHMARHEYVAALKRAAESIEPDELRRLNSIVQDVWQYIGSDVLAACGEQGEDPDNESCIESCLDADRPLTCTHGEQNVEAHAFCKAMYAKYGFAAVVRAVSKNLQLV
jgi:hypothetical protein